MIRRLVQRVRARRAARRRADAAIARFLPREFGALDDTQEFDVPSLFDDRPDQT